MENEKTILTTACADERRDYDTPEKELEEYPDVFADIINALVYQGKSSVNPDTLKPAATETHYRDLTGKLKKQTEDLGKYEVVDGETKVLFLLANQSMTDSRMVLRKSGYTGGYYRGQYNGQTKEICPVVELILYWGQKRWRSPRSMRSFFRKKCLTEELWNYINNEKIHVFEMRHLSKEVIERFHSDMRIVLEFLSDEPDENCFKQKIKHTWAVRELLIVLLGNNKYRELEKGFKGNEVSEKSQESEEGECTMRDWIGEAWDKGIQQGKEQGIAQGKAQGITQGKAQGIAQGIEALISTCHDFGASFDETAEKLKEKFGLADAEVQKDMARYW